MISNPMIFGSGQTVAFSSTGMFQYPANVTVPASVTALRPDAGSFNGHTEIETVSFEDGSTISAIPNNAFANCTGLKNITLPASVTTLNSACFAASGLTSITIPATVTRIYNICQSCKSLKSVQFQSIPACSYYAVANSNNPFYGCTALEDYQLPEGWTENLLISNGTANYTNVLTHDSMVAMIANLYDYSGGTAHTLTLGATNLARLSAEEQAVAAAKNWTLA